MADRIDNENGTVVVTDYKTGTVEARELKLKGNWTEKLDEGKSGKALQLLMYAAIALETLGPDGRQRTDATAKSIGSGPEYARGKTHTPASFHSASMDKRLLNSSMPASSCVGFRKNYKRCMKQILGSNMKPSPSIVRIARYSTLCPNTFNSP